MKKTDRIEIRVTPEEKMLITLKSKQANQSISEFLIKSSTENKTYTAQYLLKSAFNNRPKTQI